MLIGGSDVMLNGHHRPSLLPQLATHKVVNGFRLVLFAAACSYLQPESLIIMTSFKTTYAEAVTGSSSFLTHACWSHLQTQDEEDAIVLAVQNSLSIKPGFHDRRRSRIADSKKKLANACDHMETHL